MKGNKVEQFMHLAGQEVAEKLHCADPLTRELGARLLLSEVLEYVIHGLGVRVSAPSGEITDPNGLTYQASAGTKDCDTKEMLDGLCDVAYTMYWNALAFGIPLEDGFELVCDNNLEKFVVLEGWQGKLGEMPKSQWSCGRDVSWPEEVVKVEVIKMGNDFYAVGKDCNGKVRKPSNYRPVDLAPLLIAGNE